jgi:exopolysaccharide biosynthesis polyprenyl glycosylphosphotransferase
MLNKSNNHFFIFKFLDWLAAVLAWLAFFIFRKIYVDKYPLELDNIMADRNFFIALLSLPIIWILWYSFTGQYHQAYRQSRLKTIFTSFWQSFLGVLIIFFILLLDDKVSSYKNYYATFSFLLIIHFILTVSFRVSLLTFIKDKMSKGEILINALIVGSKFKAHQFYEEVLNNPQVYGYCVKGRVGLNGESVDNSGQLNFLGNIDDLEEICNREFIEDVIIAVEQKEHTYINRILISLSLQKVFIRIIPDLYDILSGSVSMSEVVGAPLIDIYPDAMDIWQQNTKRIMDVLVSLGSMIFLAPVMLILAAIIKIGDRGDVFYAQMRVGKGGVPFSLFKFRSMGEDAEPNGPALSSDNDTRITPFGRIMRKWRIDELPQFWNVLKGEMSLIGPRPERQHFINQMSVIAPQVKHLQRVKPGLTSLGMVKYGYAQNVEEMIDRLKYDIIYIEKRSLGLDFKIFLYTIVTLIRGRGK